GHTLEVPDVRDRGGELDVAHPLTANLRARHLDAAAFTDDALEAHALVLAAVALPVPGGTEDLLAEEAVTLRLERAVVDRLGLLDLAERPVADVVGGRETDLELIEEVHIEHGVFYPFRNSVWGPAQSSSTDDGSRRDRSIPSSSAARKNSSSESFISTAVPSAESTSTLRHSDCISLTRTLNDSGIPGSGTFSPFTMASYT